MEYSIQVKNDIKKLYLEGLSYKDIGYTLRIPATNLSHYIDYDDFSNEEVSQAIKELEQTHKEYDGILNLNSDKERFLNKKAIRLIALLKYHRKWPIGSFKDIVKEAKKIYPFFNHSIRKYARGNKVSYFKEREN
jgi:hypothetical protein